jgi:glucokinase
VHTYLAVDVGGTKLSAGIVDGSGVIQVRDRIATPQREVWPALLRLVRRVIAAAPTAPVACGVGCGGPLDPHGRTVSPLHIPSWTSFPLAGELEEATGLPTTVESDAKALVLGEAWCGAAVGRSDFIGVVMGTGVGGGVFSGGRLLVGRLGNAGQIGHLIVEPNGRECVCGGRGCLEAYCGGRAIELETGRPPQHAPQAIVERTGLLVGRALASLAALCDTQFAVIGGSVALGFGETFFEAVRQEAHARARLPFTTGLEIVPTGLGPDAPLIGAAALAHHYVTSGGGPGSAPAQAVS